MIIIGLDLHSSDHGKVELAGSQPRGHSHHLAGALRRYLCRFCLLKESGSHWSQILGCLIVFSVAFDQLDASAIWALVIGIITMTCSLFGILAALKRHSKGLLAVSMD